MGPKKKEEVIEEPPQNIEPEIPSHELEGIGKFEYSNGAFYEG